MGAKIHVPPGKVFGRWTVIEEVESTRKPSGDPVRRFKCQCKCGTIGTPMLESLRSGHSRSCGCLQKEVVSARAQTHGGSGTPEYKVWAGGVSRCTLPSATGYHRYGGRGIKVCEQWQGEGGFEAFLADMGLRPTPKHSIERIDNNGDYCPENCCWATKRQQGANRRNNRIIEYDGMSLSLTEWADLYGLPAGAFRQRLVKLGWSMEDALHTPLQKQKKKQRRKKPNPVASWEEMQVYFDPEAAPLFEFLSQTKGDEPASRALHRLLLIGLAVGEEELFAQFTGSSQGEEPTSNAPFPQEVSSG